MIYTLCVILLLFSPLVSESSARWDIGWALIAICYLYVVVNTIVIATACVRILLLHLRRLVMLRRRNRLRHEAMEASRALDSDIVLIDEASKA